MPLIGLFLSSRSMATDSEMAGSEAILISMKALTGKFDTLQKEVEELKRRSPSKSGSSSSYESWNESDRDHRRRSYRRRPRSRHPRSRRSRSMQAPQPQEQAPQEQAPQDQMPQEQAPQEQAPQEQAPQEHAGAPGGEQAWSRDSRAGHEQGWGGGGGGGGGADAPGTRDRSPLPSTSWADRMEAEVQEVMDYSKEVTFPDSDEEGGSSCLVEVSEKTKKLLESKFTQSVTNDKRRRAKGRFPHPKVKGGCGQDTPPGRLPEAGSGSRKWQQPLNQTRATHPWGFTGATWGHFPP